MKRVETKTISGAMRELEKTIQSADGVANMACREAADRLDEQEVEIERLRLAIAETLDEQGHLADGDNCTLIKLKNAL